mmetsp:Transcript_104945/g.323688  ORF Transcript_104945/g.323688 Transcript_104945/m.323688 type:complete len:447 (+) Transcript_104945:283-1623(+)
MCAQGRSRSERPDGEVGVAPTVHELCLRDVVHMPELILPRVALDGVPGSRIVDAGVHLELHVPAARVKSCNRAIVVCEQRQAEFRHVLGAEDLTDGGVDDETHVAGGRVEAGDHAAPATNTEYAARRGLQAPDFVDAGVDRVAHGTRSRLQAGDHAEVAGAEGNVGALWARCTNVPPHLWVYVIQHLPGGWVQAHHPAGLLRPGPASAAQHLAGAGHVGERPSCTDAGVDVVAHVPRSGVHARHHGLRAATGEDDQASRLRMHRARVLANATIERPATLACRGVKGRDVARPGAAADHEARLRHVRQAVDGGQAAADRGEPGLPRGGVEARDVARPVADAKQQPQLPDVDGADKVANTGVDAEAHRPEVGGRRKLLLGGLRDRRGLRHEGLGPIPLGRAAGVPIKELLLGVGDPVVCYALLLCLRLSAAQRPVATSPPRRQRCGPR